MSLDFIEGLDADHRWNLYTIVSEHYALEPWTEERFDETAFDTLRHFSKSIEEAGEMVAISILWFLFLCHLSTMPGDARGPLQTLDVVIFVV